MLGLIPLQVMYRYIYEYLGDELYLFLLINLKSKSNYDKNLKRKFVIKKMFHERKKYFA